MMSVIGAIQDQINAFPAGKVFCYSDIPNYIDAPNTVVKALGRIVLEGTVKRLAKGQFYIPRSGLLGTRKPSDDELIRTMLYKEGCLRGYITGLALYNKLGLTTQVPSTITVAINGSRQKKQFGTITVKSVVTFVPVKKEDVQLLQYLDALKDIKKIPGAKHNDTLQILGRYISDLSEAKQKRLMLIAREYYKPQVRALLGLLLMTLNLPFWSSLKKSLNPITKYQLDLDKRHWSGLPIWNIE